MKIIGKLPSKSPHEEVSLNDLFERMATESVKTILTKIGEFPVYYSTVKSDDDGLEGCTVLSTTRKLPRVSISSTVDFNTVPTLSKDKSKQFRWTFLQVLSHEMVHLKQLVTEFDRSGYYNFVDSYECSPVGLTVEQMYFADNLEIEAFAHDIYIEVLKYCGRTGNYSKRIRSTSVYKMILAAFDGDEKHPVLKKLEYFAKEWKCFYED